MNESLSRLRREYRREVMTRAAMDPDPVEQFKRWLDDCRRAGLAEWNALSLATVSRDGHPSSRIVLLKGVEQGGFVFFTNYRSRKGREIENNPEVALTCWWPPLERQVRIEGRAARVEAAQSDAYFRERPRGSRLGAIVSPQSEVVGSYRELEEGLAALAKQYGAGDDGAAGAGDDIPRPAHWGGYRVTPRLVEFWQGRPNRLHDRIVYRLQSGGWRMERLAP